MGARIWNGTKYWEWKGSSGIENNILAHLQFILIMPKVKKSKEGYSSLQASLPSPLRELTCHMGSHSVTCSPTEVTFPPLPQPKLVLDLATPEGCKAELT